MNTTIEARKRLHGLRDRRAARMAFEVATKQESAALGAVLRHARIRSRQSVESVAIHLGVTGTHVSDMERGAKPIVNFEMAERWIAYLEGKDR